MQSSVSTLPVQDSLAIKGRGVLWRIKTELFILVLTLYLGTRGGGGGGDEDLPLPVTGRVGETVTLPCTLNLTDPIDRVTWMFHVNGKKILLAEFRDQKFIRENKNYFPNRLEGSNTGTALLIRKLRMEDSGIFTARFLVNGEEAEITYNVTVGLGGGDVPLPVTGRVGETVSLTPRLNLTDPIIGVTWMVDRNGKKILLAEFRDQNFINHLEETTLQIRELRMEDSGIFTAQILFKRKIIDIYYNVTVLEPLPIPTPVIEKTLDGNSTDLCHLHCSVPSNSPTLSYSWTYRDTGTDRLYANGSTITVSLKDKALGAEFTCWVQNPAHRNSTSVPLYPCGEAQTKAQTKDKDFVFYIVISGTGRDYLLSLLPPMGWFCVILAFIITAVCIAVYKAVYKAVYSRRRRAMQDRRMLEYITNAGNSFPATSTDQVLETLSGNQLSRNLRITQFWLVITGKASS
ncbi:SLAM family member 6 isoform X2 [Xenopus tropicalis]|uniref:SLAM family member 6 isoform X2 n=1 Tax=Xenopus tropicalis TaxID=8364 RepID=A0A8J1INT4_XENTR|nr:SLAM family member 6 isoform X2 [Xenopus tropicalis]